MTIRSLRNSVDGLKALGHPARLRILALLRGGELCVCQVTAVLGLAPSTISEHLSVMRRAGFIEERKEGKWVFYALSGDPALAPLCEAVWTLVAGDAEIKDDVRACARIRKMPIPLVFRASSGSSNLEAPSITGAMSSISALIEPAKPRAGVPR